MTPAALFWIWLGGFVASSSIGLVIRPRGWREWRTWVAWAGWPVLHVYALANRRRSIEAAASVVDQAIEDEIASLNEDDQ